MWRSDLIRLWLRSTLSCQQTLTVIYWLFFFCWLFFRVFFFSTRNPIIFLGSSKGKINTCWVRRQSDGPIWQDYRRVFNSCQQTLTVLLLFFFFWPWLILANVTFPPENSESHNFFGFEQSEDKYVLRRRQSNGPIWQDYRQVFNSCQQTLTVYYHFFLAKKKNSESHNFFFGS